MPAARDEQPDKELTPAQILGGMITELMGRLYYPPGPHFTSMDHCTPLYAYNDPSKSSDFAHLTDGDLLQNATGKQIAEIWDLLAKSFNSKQDSSGRSIGANWQPFLSSASSRSLYDLVSVLLNGTDKDLPNRKKMQLSLSYCSGLEGILPIVLLRQHRRKTMHL